MILKDFSPKAIKKKKKYEKNNIIICKFGGRFCNGVV